MNSLFYKSRRTQGVEEVCLENKEECKSSRAFESFRRRGIIEKPSRGDTVLTNSLILYGSVANRQLRRTVNPFPSGVGGSAPPWPTISGCSSVSRARGLGPRGREGGTHHSDQYGPVIQQQNIRLLSVLRRSITVQAYHPTTKENLKVF